MKNLTVCCSALLCAWTVSSQAGVLYGAEVFGSARLTTLDRANGVSSTVGFFGIEGPFGMAYSDASGTAYLVDQSPVDRGLYSVDLASGHATRIGSAGLFGAVRPRGLAWRASLDRLYTVDLDTNTLYQVNESNGALSDPVFLSNVGGCSAVTYDNVSDQLYGIAAVVIGQGTGWHVVRIDPDTGVGNSVLELGSGVDWRGLAYDTDHRVFWTHNTTTGFLTAIDLSAQTLTPIGSTLQQDSAGTSLNALVFIPSPGAIAGALVSLSVVCRRQRR